MLFIETISCRYQLCRLKMLPYVDILKQFDIGIAVNKTVKDELIISNTEPAFQIKKKILSSFDH